MNIVARLIMVVVLSTIVSVMCNGCTSPEASRETLRKGGYTDIVITGWDAFGCSDSDTFSTGFRARNPQNQAVEGVVCCGLLKRCTIRF